MKLSEISLDLCPPVLSTFAMRELDEKIKQKNATNEIEAVKAGYALMQMAGLALFTHVQKLVKKKI